MALASDRKTLLTNLWEKVWGKPTILEEQLSWSDLGTKQSHTVRYFDFSECLAEIQVISPTIYDAQFLVREEYRHAVDMFEKNDIYNKGACIMGQPGIGKIVEV